MSVTMSFEWQVHRNTVFQDLQSKFDGDVAVCRREERGFSKRNKKKKKKKEKERKRKTGKVKERRVTCSVSLNNKMRIYSVLPYQEMKLFLLKVGSVI